MRLVQKIGWAAWLLIAVSCGARTWAQTGGQPGTTTVADTVLTAGGTAAAGTVSVSWGAFVTSAGVPVAAGSLSVTLGSGGALSIPLLPNADATPLGSFYTAVFHLSDGITSREFWVVPVTSSGTVPLAAIRNQALPTSVAMQTVSKAYVDTTVAKAMAGTRPGGPVPYLLKSGDTMTGPLTLGGDPASALQAADKHYVDALAGNGLTNGSTAGGDLSGTFPAPQVKAVHAVAGSLDGVTIGGTSAAPLTGTRVTATTSSSTLPGFVDGQVQIYGVTNAPICNLCTYVSGASMFGLGQVYAQSTLIANDGNTAQDSIAFYLGKAPDTGGNASDADFYWGAGLFSMATASAVGWSAQANGYAGTAGAPQPGLQAQLSSPAAGVVSCDSGSKGNHACTLVAGAFHEALTTPASSSASCAAGDFTDDASFHYVCVADGQWKRVALSSF